MTQERKYIQKGNQSDGPVTVSDNDAVANHAAFFDRRELSFDELKAALKNLPDQALRNLAVRERNLDAGTHQRPPVNSESREVTLNNVSRLAAARLYVAGVLPRISRTSALFNEATAYVLMSEEEQNQYERRHPERF
jgi:hypothetical protein